jgi:hypothetical protein
MEKNRVKEEKENRRNRKKGIWETKMFYITSGLNVCITHKTTTPP